MTQKRSRFGPLRAFAAIAVAMMCMNFIAPAAIADEPAGYVADLQVISATVDVATGHATVTYSFRCLQPITLVRIRSYLIQRHAGNDEYGWSWETFGVRDCQPGTTVTLPGPYGGQEGRYFPGHADLQADLYAYVGSYTADSDSVVGTVLLRPLHGKH